MASRVMATDGKLGQSQLLSRLEPTTACVGSRRLEPGIQLNEWGVQRLGRSIGSPAVEAVAACHFDKSDRSLGVQGDSSYNGYFGAYTVSVGGGLVA